jgi:proteasome lid subunit RPN8/RPN11
MSGQIPRRAVVLPAQLRAVLLREAERHLPAEACGLLLARIAEPLRVCDAIALPNCSAALDDYEIEAEAVRRIEQSARAHAQHVTGFYHSHPLGGAEPSERDLNAAWPGYIYLIVGSAPAPGPRAWRLLENRERFEEIPLLVEPS